MKTRYQITESKTVEADRRLRTIFLEDEATLAELPKALTDTMAIGSIAYTMGPWKFFHWTNEGWRDGTGTVVSV